MAPVIQQESVFREFLQKALLCHLKYTRLPPVVEPVCLAQGTRTGQVRQEGGHLVLARTEASSDPATCSVQLAKPCGAAFHSSHLCSPQGAQCVTLGGAAVIQNSAHHSPFLPTSLSSFLQIEIPQIPTEDLLSVRHGAGAGKCETHMHCHHCSLASGGGRPAAHRGLTARMCLVLRQGGRYVPCAMVMAEMPIFAFTSLPLGHAHLQGMYSHAQEGIFTEFLVWPGTVGDTQTAQQ